MVLERGCLRVSLLEVDELDVSCIPNSDSGNLYENSSDTRANLSREPSNYKTPRDLSKSGQVLKVLYSASIQLVTAGRFMVKYSGYHDELVDLFKDFPEGILNRRNMSCSFSVEQYNKVVGVLRDSNDQLKRVTLKVHELDIIPRAILSAAACLQDDTERYIDIAQH